MTYIADAKQLGPYTGDNLGRVAKDFFGVTEHSKDTARLWVLLEEVYQDGHRTGQQWWSTVGAEQLRESVRKVAAAALGSCDTETPRGS